MRTIHLHHIQSEEIFRWQSNFEDATKHPKMCHPKSLYEKLKIHLPVQKYINSYTSLGNVCILSSACPM